MLSVVPNSISPNMMNVSGANMTFEVSATGTVGRMNIDAPDYLVNVWMTTGTTTCNIQWYQIYVSRNNMHQRILPDPDDMIVYSLSGVTGTMAGESLYSGLSNAFVILESTSELYYRQAYVLYRKGLGGLSYLDAQITGTANNMLPIYVSTYLRDCFCSIEDGKLFGVVGGFGTNATGTMSVNTYNFSNKSITNIYNDPATTNEMWRAATITGDYGAENLTVTSEALTARNLIVRDFNARDESFVRKVTLSMVTGTSVLGTLSPQIYNDYIIYPIENIPGHQTGIVIYDVSTGASGHQEIVDDNIVWSWDVFTSLFIREVGVDYENGWYYYVTMKYDYVATVYSVVDIILYKVTISLSPTITLIRHIDTDDYLKFVTGKSKLYGVKYKAGDLEEMSSASIVGSVPAEVMPLPYTAYPTYAPQVFSPQLDEVDQRIWFVQNTGSALYGASIIGDGDKIITLTNGTFVTDPIVSMNLVSRGVIFTAANKMGLVQG